MSRIIKLPGYKGDDKQWSICFSALLAYIKASQFFFNILAITPAFVPGTGPEPLPRAFPGYSCRHPVTEEFKLRHKPTSLIHSKLQQQFIREESNCYFGQESAHFRLLI